MRIVFIAALSLILFNSCGGPAPKQAPKPAAAKPAKKAPAAPKASTEETKTAQVDDVFAIKSKQFDYKYNPIGKRDIFKPYEGEMTFLEDRERTPLERYDLSQLTLTAIVWGISEPRALVKAPDGQDYIIKRDMRIGRNSGRIARITKQEVIVAEEYRDPLGKLIIRETPLALHKKTDLDDLMLELQ